MARGISLLSRSMVAATTGLVSLTAQGAQVPPKCRDQRPWSVVRIESRSGVHRWLPGDSGFGVAADRGRVGPPMSRPASLGTGWLTFKWSRRARSSVRSCRHGARLICNVAGQNCIGDSRLGRQRLHGAAFVRPTVERLLSSLPDGYCLGLSSVVLDRNSRHECSEAQAGASKGAGRRRTRSISPGLEQRRRMD